MCQHAKELARRAGAEDMALFVNAVNRSAIAFFEVLGFAQVKGEPLVTLVADQPGRTIENNLVFVEYNHFHALKLTL